MLFAMMLLLAAGPWEEGFIPLFNGRDLSGWTHFIERFGANEDGSMKISDFCFVLPQGPHGVARDGVLRCKTTEWRGSGQARPFGWLMSEKTFTNLTLKLQWRWPAAPGKSGVFVRTQPRTPQDKGVFPKGVEAEMNGCENCSLAGDIWFLGAWPDVKCTPPCSNVHPRSGNLQKNQPRWKDNARMNGEWNDYEITIYKDRLTLKVNGEVVNEFSGIPEIPGHILLQVEGGTVDFRDIRIKELK